MLDANTPPNFKQLDQQNRLKTNAAIQLCQITGIFFSTKNEATILTEFRFAERKACAEHACRTKA
jgi:hypothetical protein